MKADYVFDIDEIPQTEDCQLGVVVSMERRQMHCGLAFDIATSLKIIHLATFKDVECKTEWGNFLVYVKPNIDPYIQELLVPYFDAVYNSIQDGHSKIPYALGYENYATVKEDGKVDFGANGIGLTCATYILSLFHTKEFDLVDIHNWPVREDDKRWQIKILNYFYDNREYFKISIEFLQKMWEQFGCPRFRPEEVAVSSALYNDAPAETQIIWNEGKLLRDYVASKVEN